MEKPPKTLHLKAIFICLIAAIFYCYEYLLRIEPSIMVSQLMQRFSVAASGIGILSALYYSAYAPMQLAAGVLLDRFGSRKILSIGIISCTLGSVLFTLPTSIFFASIARFFIGFGSSFAFVGVLKLGAEWLPKKHFALLVGLTTSLGMVGGMTGGTILTFVLNKTSYISILHLGTLLGLMLVPIIIIFIQDRPGKINPARLLLKFHDIFLGLKALIKNPQMWIVGIVACVLFLSLSAFAEMWGIKFLENVYSLSAQEAGVACSFIFLGWLIGSPLAGWISQKIQSQKNLIVGGGFLSAFVILFIIIKPFAISLYILALLLFLFGLFSSTEILCFAISKEFAPHALSATVLAFTNFLIMIGGVIFQPLIGILLDFTWTGLVVNYVHEYTKESYQLVFLILPLIVLLGSLLALKLKDPLEKK